MDKDKNGLQIAFGLTNYDNNFEMLHEPEYGELEVSMRTWNANSGNQSIIFNSLQMRPCNEKELGLGPLGYDDPDSRFYPAF